LIAAMFLTRDELFELTGRRRSGAQVIQLRSMGIEHRLRADGSVAVLRAHVELIFGAIGRAEQKVKNSELDWST
jgi:hypothetical protein